MIAVGLDTNFLAYLVGIERGDGDAEKVSTVRALYERLIPRVTLHVPLQALGELYNVVHKVRVSRASASEAVQSVRRWAVCDAVTETVFGQALDLAVAHRMQIWDAIIVDACAMAGCILLLSEDMQDGFKWRGMTVTNPFADKGLARLRRMVPESIV